MNAVARRPGDNKIGATFVFSLLVHGLLLFGIGVGYVATRPALPTLDVTLVNVANSEAPDKADFLAQANNKGGGESDKTQRPSQPFSGLLPLPSQGIAPQPVTAATPSPQQATDQRMLTTTGQANFSVNSDNAKDVRDTPDTATADEARLAREAAQLAAEVRQQSQAYAKRPHKKFISANTKEYVYAAYMRGWVDRIERVGNLNYPQQARDQHLHGDVILTVGLNRDGSIYSIDVTQSSGYSVIDKAAIAIVKLCAPFPALPPDNKEKVDILYITRTWQFQPGDVLKTR
ncbi:TonB family protein [Dyella nitratireducens]|uniref:Cell envelope biogenesis protein TonB n=1 Tax=Dyella nitratireducens TaxID=1849580 RepID=A0ABQ1G0F7_9GAMM|nr:TonB family protein [Dyella nitratireducens]GGA34758.1 cell envelope biogenesis protein TonB [Dyella nitratireducens]GLQ40911.1 cell envelope biogenesis protein TonB [Dyella nitratireducens]